VFINTIVDSVDLSVVSVDDMIILINHASALYKRSERGPDHVSATTSDTRAVHQDDIA